MTKFQKLTKKEKVEHIWEYYRYHIIGGMLASFMIISLLTTVFGPKPPESAVSVVIMGVYRNSEEQQTKFKNEIENIIDDEEAGKVEVLMFPVDWNSESPMDMAMSQKLVLMFQTRDIDIMIVEDEKFDSFIMNIDEMIYYPLDGETELISTLEENKDKLVNRKLAGESQKRVYGLTAKDNKKLQGIGLTENYVISIPAVSDKKENALKTIKWLFE